MRVGPSVNEVQLVDLIPNTEYTLTAHVLFGDIISDPLTSQEVTCMYILVFALLLLLQQNLTFILFNATVFIYSVLFRRPSRPYLMHFIALSHCQKTLQAISMKRYLLFPPKRNIFFSFSNEGSYSIIVFLKMTQSCLHLETFFSNSDIL